MFAFSGGNGQFSFNRAVVLGFVVPHDGSVSFVSIDNTELVIAQLVFPAYYHFVFTGQFMTSHTNSYTLDHVFDLAACFLVYAGPSFTPTFSSKLAYTPGEFSPRISVDFGLGTGHSFLVDIPAAASPWYVRNP
jgi:hypothetical protein